MRCYQRLPFVTTGSSPGATVVSHYKRRNAQTQGPVDYRESSIWDINVHLGTCGKIAWGLHHEAWISVRGVHLERTYGAKTSAWDLHLDLASPEGTLIWDIDAHLEHLIC